MEQRKSWRKMKAGQRLFSLAGLAPGTSFKWVDDQFPFCFKFFWQEIPKWMCSKLLCFYFKGFYFFFICEGKALEVLCRRHLSAGPVVSPRELCLCSQLHGDPMGQQFLLFSHTSGRLSHISQHPESREMAKVMFYLLTACFSAPGCTSTVCLA